METPNLKTIGIGTKRLATLKSAPCVVEAVDTEIVGEGKKAGTKAVFTVKHPDKEEPIRISTISLMRQRKDKKEIVSLGSWINLDEDGQLQMESAVVVCLQFYQSGNLQEMVGKTVQTEPGSDGYLAIKAY